MDSIMQKAKACYHCGRAWGLDKHHVMNGNPQRKYAEADGLTVWLCRECHDLIHRDATLRLELKEKAQAAWLRIYGIQAFRERYGKSYL